MTVTDTPDQHDRQSEPGSDWFVRLVRSPAGTVVAEPAPESTAKSPTAFPPAAEPPPLPLSQADGDSSTERPVDAAGLAPPPLPPSDASHDRAVTTPAAAPATDSSPPPLPEPRGVSPSDRPTRTEEPDTSALPRSDADAVAAVPMTAIAPNPDQPRRSFDQDEIQALAASIASQGVIQPILVRHVSTEPDAYQIIAGERRWRAARMAGLTRIPAIVRAVDDGGMAEVALVENIQRADLPPLEEAQAYQALLDRHGYTQDDLAHRMGKSRSHIAHLLRLLRLPDAVRALVSDGQLSVGHARLLVNAADPTALAQRIVAEELSVRQTETLLKRETTTGGHADQFARAAAARTRPGCGFVGAAPGQRTAAPGQREAGPQRRQRGNSL